MEVSGQLNAAVALLSWKKPRNTKHEVVWAPVWWEFVTWNTGWVVDIIAGKSVCLLLLMQFTYVLLSRTRRLKLGFSVDLEFLCIGILDICGIMTQWHSRGHLILQLIDKINLPIYKHQVCLDRCQNCSYLNCGITCGKPVKIRAGQMLTLTLASFSPDCSLVLFARMCVYLCISLHVLDIHFTFEILDAIRRDHCPCSLNDIDSFRCFLPKEWPGNDGSQHSFGHYGYLTSVVNINPQ
jgi:hypothetical protein